MDYGVSRVYNTCNRKYLYFQVHHLNQFMLSLIHRNENTDVWQHIKSYLGQILTIKKLAFYKYITSFVSCSDAGRRFIRSQTTPIYIDLSYFRFQQ